MGDLKQIKTLLKQNKKIIRYASMSVSLLGNFEAEVIKQYNENKKTINDYRIDINGFHIAYTDLKEKTESSILDINENGIKMSVKSKDVIKELNTELKIDGNIIDCTSKRFLIDTKNLKIKENGLYFKGIVNGLSCNIAGFEIKDNNMTCKTGSIYSGNIKSDRLNLHNALAEYIDCNPDNISGKNVKFSSCVNWDKDEKEETNTIVTGLNVKGNMWCTNGWNDSEHGTPYSLSCGNVYCERLLLSKKSGSYGLENRLRCSEIYSESQDDYWSDRRLKRDIKAIPPENVEKLWENADPVSFRMVKTNKKYYGYIAQDLEQALKKADIKGVVAMDKRGYKAIAYPELTAFRILQIQNNARKIERLENEYIG